MLDNTILDHFRGGPGYLNTASVGIPPTQAVDVLRNHLDDWENGACDPVSFDVEVDRARTAYARVAGVEASSVSIVGQVSVASGMVASSLPDGAKVLCAEEDFTSLLYPFLADPRLDVQLVPLDGLLDHVERGVDLVAVSAVQSADGRVMDLDALADITDGTGIRTYIDASQAAGWLPLDADRFDVMATGAYKWLCSPRGTGFVTVAPHNDWLVSRHPGWYAGDLPWQSIYGPPLQLADDARRFNVSPAWFDFAAAAPAIELLADVGVEAVQQHSVHLANHFRAELGLPASNSAIVSIETELGDALAEAGVSAATRAGRVRLSFYVYNTIADAELAAVALRK